MKGEAAVERIINPTKIKVQKNGDGGLIFSRLNNAGKPLEIETQEDYLIDALHSTLWPLGNLKGIMDKEDDDPGPLYYLLRDMLEEAQYRIGEIVAAVEEEVGRIKVYRCDECGPIKRGEVLGISVEEVTA